MRILLGLLVVVVVALGPAAACRPTAAAPQRAAADAPARVVRVDVWHDTICPWCRIGLANLESAVARMPAGSVEVVHHPFELDPTTPPEGVDLRARLGAKYGADKLEQMFARVSDAGARYGIAFRWDRVTRSPNTLASHALLAWAPDAKRSDVMRALHRAHFEDGKDIGDPDVLAALAKDAGLDGDAARAAVTDPERLQAVRDAARQAARRGVRSVPHFEIGGGATGARVLTGAQSPEALAQVIAGVRGAH